MRLSVEIINLDGILITNPRLSGRWSVWKMFYDLGMIQQVTGTSKDFPGGVGGDGEQVSRLGFKMDSWGAGGTWEWAGNDNLFL